MSTFSSEKIVSAVVESWDFSYVVDRAVRAGMPKEVAPVALAQLKQFLLQCALLPEANLVPQSQACDDLWHEFIVSDTRAYFRFCNAVYGRYLHHDGVTVGAEEMDKARAVSTEVFGAGSDVVCGRVSSGITCERPGEVICGRITDMRGLAADRAICGRIFAR